MSTPYRLANPTPPAPLAIAATRPTPLRRKLRRLRRRAGLSSSFWLTSICGAVLLTVINGAGHGPLWFVAVLSAQAAALVAIPAWRGSQRLRERMLRHAHGVQRERRRRALPHGVRELLDSPSLIDQEVGRAAAKEARTLGSSAVEVIHGPDGRIITTRVETRTTATLRAAVVVPLGPPNDVVSK